jgi:hypothetical protein
MKEDSGTENPKKEDKKKSSKSKASKFLEKLDFVQLSQHELQKNEKNQDPKDSKSGNERENHDPHAFPMISDILGEERVKKIKSGNSKILMGIGIFAGILLIIFGAVMIMGSADRIADNVVFGEREVFSVFLILAGILLIACSFAYKFLGNSLFKGIDDDIESYDKKSSDSTKNNVKKG